MNDCFSKGYTLLELLVVLLILGLMTALTMPRLLTLYERLQVSQQRDDVLTQLNRLGFVAFSQGQAFTLTQYPPPETAVNQPAPPLTLPPGWSLLATPPIHYRANGVCEGGTLTMHYQQHTYPLRLAPPFCQALPTS